MVTNQLMIRKMGDFDVIQRTKDGYFNATKLIGDWDKKNDITKNVNHYLSLSSTKEFIDTIIKRESDIPNHERPVYQAFIKTKCVTFANGSKKAGEYWFCPYLFLDFAMWINPSFKYDVLKFVSDQMIHFRNLSGDAYRRLATQVQKIVEKSFMPTAMQKIGEALNWVIFNCNEKEARNKFGDENKQNELYQFEIKVADLIDDGFIKNYDSLIRYLRKQYFKHNKPF